MKRIALAATAALALACMCATTAVSQSHHHRSAIPERCKITPFRAFSSHVWSPGHWRRGAPPAVVIQTQRRRLACAPPGHRRAMQRTWRRDKASFNHHRRKMLWRAHFKPFVYPDGERWAVPYPIAWCESGGDYFIGPYGAYGLIMESAWLPPRVQDEIAHRLYAEQGEAPWAPFEGGCAYR